MGREGRMDLPFDGPLIVRPGTYQEFDQPPAWIIEWDHGLLGHLDWHAAVSRLDNWIRDMEINSDAIVLAGSYAVPWVLSLYCEAAEAAEKGDAEGVFKAYGQSAAILLKENLAEKDDLVLPWGRD